MNSDIFRSLARPAAHLVFYGTSLTKSGGWTETIVQELRIQYPNLKAFNSACDGQHSRWGRENFGGFVLELKPDALFLEFAINDAVDRFSISVAEARANLEQMLDCLTTSSRDCAVVLQVMNPVVGRPLGHDGYRPDLPAYEQVYRDVAQERGLLLVDHAPAWAALLACGEPEFLRYVPDGLHPDAAGYDRFMLPRLRAALDLPQC